MFNNMCVKECSLADYVNGAQTEKVPFVFMPQQGQLVNPNAEISLSGTYLLIMP